MSRKQPEQLKPGYNMQIGTENQFVVGFSVHQRPGDSGCLILHLEGFKAQLGRLPEKVIADAGYGSEENYFYLDEEGIEAYVKYNTFHLEQKRRKKDRFRGTSFPYDEARDEFIRPAEKRLAYTWTEPYQTENGFHTELRVYECEDCSGCVLKPLCTRAIGSRRIRMSFRWRELRDKASSNLLSKQGMVLRLIACRKRLPRQIRVGRSTNAEPRHETSRSYGTSRNAWALGRWYCDC